MNDKKNLQTLSKYLDYKKEDKNIVREVECRFEIDYQIVDIVKKLNHTQLFSIEEEKSIVEFHMDKKNETHRKIKYTFPFERTVKQIKRQILYDKINLQGYPVKFVYSHEIENDIVEIDNPEIKKRSRYIIKNFLGDEYELHLTSAFDPFQKKQKEQIEVEYNMDKIKNPTQFFTPIKYIFDLMYVKSIELLSPIYILPIIDDFNENLGKLKGYTTKTDKNNVRNHKLIDYEDKPVSIKEENLQIVNSEKYFVTNKLNGTRYFLFIKESIFYLIGKTGSKISTIPTLVWKLFKTSKIPSNVIFILDGEYFDGLKNTKLYYAFDIIISNNKPSVSLKYEERLSHLEKFTTYISKFSPVEMKFIKYGNSAEEVVRYMKDLFENEWDYDNDGLIYTPSDNLYANKDYPPLKWKFAHHQSVDVLVKKTVNPNYYECYVGVKDGIDRFTEYLLYSPNELLENSIVEVSFDKSKMEFYFMRLRPDKENPNFIIVAESFWTDIMKQIPLNILTGTILTLKDIKIDWEKYNLIQIIDGTHIFIDIGFGNIFKYTKKRIDFIIVIEPDYENIKEFFQRYNIIEPVKKEIYDNTVSIDDKKIRVIVINKSAVDLSIINIVNKKIQWENYRKKCANKEKYNLIQTIDPTHIVIDIGFGKGGDIFKYSKRGIDFIIGIEPDYENIKEFFQRYNIIEPVKKEIYDNTVSIDDKKIRVIVINKSAVHPGIINTVTQILDNTDRLITVCMFFSLTYFFNPYDDFVKLIYIITQFFPKRILGTVMDGKPTKNFIENYTWNSAKCGLELRLISNNKVFISIEESATVSGHNEYLCDLDRFENYLKLYNYKLSRKEYFNFFKGKDNLLTHFASINCLFDFQIEVDNEPIIEPEIQYDINKLCIGINSRFGINLDSIYFYKCFMSQDGNILEIIENFFKTRAISKFYIEKKIEQDDLGNDIEFFTFNNVKLNKYQLDNLRYLLLCNKYDKNYRFVYKIPSENNEFYKSIVKKLFYKDENFELSNVYYDYYLTNENNSSEIISHILQYKSPLSEYNIFEYNSGIGNLTIEFAKIFKNVFVYENSLANYKISKCNFVKYYEKNSQNIESKNVILVDIDGIKKEISYNNEKYNLLNKNKNSLYDLDIMFINYQFNNQPSIKSIKNIKHENCKFIIILTPNVIEKITEYYKDFQIYKLKYNYLYFINNIS